MGTLSFLWLEITGNCQLQCTHCYAESGPHQNHGSMSRSDWLRVIDEAATLGVEMVQFIGGEPTLNPALPNLVEHALSRGVDVEIYSNLVHVRSHLWETLTRPGVRLATSYYTDDATQHESITTRRGSHTRTKNNMIEALRRDIPLRVGIVDLHDGQRVEQARAELASMGVVDVDVDRLRQVGRGIRDQKADATQLCGHCASGVLAVSPDGAVWPCVFSRWLPVGDVRESSLADIVAGERFQDARAELASQFRRAPDAACDPKCEPYTAGCHPECNPSCSPRCDPVSCRPNCLPPRR